MGLVQLPKGEVTGLSDGPDGFGGWRESGGIKGNPSVLA